MLTYGETHEDDVCVGIGEGPESVVVLLTGGIPQRQLDLKYVVSSRVKDMMYPSNFKLTHVILKDKHGRII